MNEINNDYMEWLEREILENGNFDTNSIVLNNLSSEDKKNVEKLEVFYNTISQYAHENNIEEYWCKNYSSYCIRYNDNCYNIIKENRDNTYVCIKRNPKESISYYIDMNKVIQNEEPKVYQKKS